MAVTATFAADFSSFLTAVDQADVKLVSFQGSTARVEQSLNRMVANFSGDKLIRDATLMAEAVDKLGGTSKLTETELEKIGQKAQDAAAKLSAMGVDVPPKLQALANQFAAANKEATGLQQVVETFGTRFTVLTSAVAIGNALADTFEAIGEKAFHAAEDGVKILVDEIEHLVLRGSVVQDISDNFDRLTESAGLAGDALLGKLKTASQGTVGDFELMQRVNSDLAAGLHLTQDQFGLLTQGAFALAKVTGGDVKAALETMSDALVTGRAKAVALLTGKIDLKAAEEAFAISLGTTADHLTAEGKLEADRQAILAGVAAAVQRVGEQHLTLKDRLEQASVAASNFEDDLGKMLAKSGVLQTGVETLGKALLSAFGSDRETAIKNFSTLIENMAIVTVGAIAEISKATASWLSQIDLALNLASQVPVIGDNFKIASVGADLATRSAFELSSAMFKARDAMQAAAREHAAFVGPINQTTNATGGFNEATSKTALVVAATAAEIKKYEEAIAHLQIVIAARADKQTHDEEEAADKRRLAAILAETDAQIQLNLAAGRDAAGAIRVQQSAYDELLQKLDALHAKKVAGISQEKEEQLLIEQFTKQLYDEAAALTIVGHGTDTLSDSVDVLAGKVFKFAQGLTTTNDELSAFYDSVARGGIDIFSGSGAIPAAHQPGYRVPKFDMGGPVTRDGLIYAHAGEYVVPRGGGTASGGITVNLTMSGVMATDRGAFQAAVSQAVMQAVKASTKVGSA